MYWFFKKKRDKEQNSLDEHSAIKWQDYIDRMEKINLQFNFFGKRIKLKPLFFQRLSFGIVVILTILVLLNIFKKEEPVFPLSNKSRAKDLNYERIFEDENGLSHKEKKINAAKRAAAIDSLITNNIFTPENIQKVKEIYPNEQCAC